MSRIGKLPIEIPKGVEIKVSPDNVISVKGPKGESSQKIDKSISVVNENGELVFKRSSEEKQVRAMHGLYRALVNNMITGVTKGYSIQQELVGVGYKAVAAGQNLELTLGYSHNVIFQLPKEIKITTVTEKGKNPIITLESTDKQLIGHVAAKIRSLRKPEPYKGKGIKFVNEQLRRKAGKSASSK
jgi:large subunit ribosomal protein L6